MSGSGHHSYIGVSGVVDQVQQRLIETRFAAAGLPTTRRLLLGVKATHKTQWLDVENRYGTDWFPVGEAAFADALGPAGRKDTTMGVAQVFLEPSLASDPTYRSGFTDRLLMRGARWLTGVQFDMLPWQVERWAASYLSGLRERGLDVLVQCHGPAMSDLGPRGCARRLAEVGEGITHVLFDASHGTGREMDAPALAAFLDAAAAEPGLEGRRLGVAGGLDANAVRDVLPALLAHHPDLSWDAEGRLHPASKAASGSRVLDMARTSEYVDASAEVLSDLRCSQHRLIATPASGPLRP
jgi:hypothetical protein